MSDDQKGIEESELLESVHEARGASASPNEALRLVQQYMAREDALALQEGTAFRDTLRTITQTEASLEPLRRAMAMADSPVLRTIRETQGAYEPVRRTLEAWDSPAMRAAQELVRSLSFPAAQAALESLRRQPVHIERLSAMSPPALQTLARGTEDLVAAAPERTWEEPPTRKVVLATATQLQRVMEMIAREPQERFNVDPRTFEEIVAELLGREGFDVTLTPLSRDGGRDVIAVKEDFAGRRVVSVECKRYARKNKVGIEYVQRLLGAVVGYDSHSGLLVTTGEFSGDARGFASRKPELVRLRDGEEFVRWLRTAGASEDAPAVRNQPVSNVFEVQNT